MVMSPGGTLLSRQQEDHLKQQGFHSENGVNGSFGEPDGLDILIISWLD
jgi:hypothetical protein